MNVKKLMAYLLAALLFLSVSARADNVRETPVVKIARDNAGAVVNISTEKIILLQQNPAWGAFGNDIDSFHKQYYSSAPAQTLKLKNVGSGVILDKEGIIVTNAHVVNMTTNIFVILTDGTQVRGEVQYENPESDLAIIKIDPPKPLQEIKLGQTKDLMVGETAIAIGNPLGLENSLSVGVISGKNRTLYSPDGRPVMTGLIQTDTPINPGNSGGALLNLNGELIAINTAMVQSSQGIGFAIPVEKVKEVLEGYRKNKNLGIKYQGKSAPVQAIYQPAPQPQQGGARNIEAEMRAMREKMDQMMRNAMSRHFAGQDMGAPNNALVYSNAKLTTEETQHAYLLTLDVKGLDKNKINIAVKPDSITISGQRSEQVTQDRAGASFNTSSMSYFSQTIPMPRDADASAVKTEVKGDALLITLPKK
ncbi:MAG: trypsin-like peptidase domain-containing protein [Candidatus Omnitrophica bacterium]|nr:trypsin-like peptidase domain-containing protein [Candidatus Omnitrophota bacterium]